MTTTGMDVPFTDGINNQEREFWYKRIIRHFPELANHPDALYGDNKLTYYRLINEGLIAEVPDYDEQSLNDYVNTAIDASDLKTAVDLLKVMGGLNPGSPSDAQNAAFTADDNSLFNAEMRKKYPSQLYGYGDNTPQTQIQAYLDTAGALGVRKLVGTFNINSNLTVPDGIYVDASNAVINVKSADKTAVYLRANSRWHGGNLNGYGLDYEPMVSGSPTVFSVGFRVLGNNVKISDVRLYNFADTAIFQNEAYTGLTLRNLDIIGVHNNGNSVIQYMDTGCFGIYIALGTDIEMTDIRVSNASIGITTSVFVEKVRLNNIYIWDIPGQHGLYLQNSTGLIADGVHGSNVALNLFKVQLQGSRKIQNYSASISNITGTDIGDTVFLMNSVEPTLVSDSSRHHAVTVTNIVGHNCGRVAYLSNIRGASVSNISGYNTVDWDATLIDVQDIIINNVTGVNSGRDVLFINNIPGSDTDGVTVTNVKARNPGRKNIAGYRSAVNISCATDGKNITVNDVSIVSDVADAAVYVANCEQETLSIRNITIGGHNPIPSFRLASATRMVKEISNVDLSGGSVNFPANLPVRIGSRGYRSEYACNVIPTKGVFSVGDRVSRGVIYQGESPGWQCTLGGASHEKVRANTTEYIKGDWVKSGTTDHVYECIAAGTSGSTEPTPPALNQTVVDGTVTWRLRGTVIARFIPLPTI